MSKIIVIGAGIIGSAVALELRRRGVQVILLESVSEGGQTSSASAGMVNPFSLTPQENPSVPFALESRRLFPDWVAFLKEFTGIDAEWRAEGSLRVALSAEEREHLQSMHDWVARYEPGAELLTEREVRQLEPAVTEQCVAGLWLPSEGWVQTERLMHALHRALHQNGSDFCRGRPATGLIVDGERVSGVRTPYGALYADAVILCAGSWTGTLLEGVGWHIPIEPVRGQILVLHDLPQRVIRLITSSLGYWVPQADGSALFGATREQAGYDMRVTVEGFGTLISPLLRLFPHMGDARIAGSRVGLRPNTPDHQPVIGALPHREGLYLASGHSYHGILLAPATALAVADLITQGRTDLMINPFRPDRFVSSKE